MANIPTLSILIWFPIAAGILILALGSTEKGVRLGKIVALVASTATFILSLQLYSGFDIDTSNMQFIERFQWITHFNAYYHVGLDGISLPLVLLTTFLTPLVVIAGWEVIELRPSQYFAAFLFLEGMMIGVFSSLS